jgi:hypothetical protein
MLLVGTFAQFDERRLTRPIVTGCKISGIQVMAFFIRFQNLRNTITVITIDVSVKLNTHFTNQE